MRLECESGKQAVVAMGVRLSASCAVCEVSEKLVLFLSLSVLLFSRLAYTCVCLHTIEYMTACACVLGVRCKRRFCDSLL